MATQRAPSPHHPELIAEALRVYRRYAIEIVEAFGLCPWATRARESGRVAERVLLQKDSSASGALECVAELAASASIDIGLLIFPRLTLDPLAFEHFIASVRDRDAERHPLGAIPFAMAAFHPGAEADVSDAERLIPFLRRTPDPTIQLVRRSVLEKVRGKSSQGTGFVDPEALDALEALASVAGADHEEQPLRERIARANHRTVLETGLENLRARLDDIRQDRTLAYARLGE
jgi:hypothetical protein